MQFVTGMTVHHYHLKVRMEHAMEDLSDFEIPVKAIALKHGFKSSSQFCRAFKEFAEMTPKEYRLQLLRIGKSLQQAK
jgi:AraC-like DNA-binding protein